MDRIAPGAGRQPVCDEPAGTFTHHVTSVSYVGQHSRAPARYRFTQRVRTSLALARQHEEVGRVQPERHPVGWYRTGDRHAGGKTEAGDFFSQFRWIAPAKGPRTSDDDEP